MLKLYVHPTCTSCRKAEALLKDEGIEYERRDYFGQRFTRDELTALFDEAGRSPNDMLSRRAKAYRALGLDEHPVDDARLVDLMLDEPTLLRRPITIRNGRSVVGFDRDALLDLARS